MKRLSSLPYGELLAPVITPFRYSGRGMMGKYCTAIQGTLLECQSAIAFAIQTAYDSLKDVPADERGEEEHAFAMIIDHLLEFKMDSFGTGVVLYWPKIEYKEIEDDQG